VCHLHYYSFATPLMMGVLASTWKERIDPALGWGMLVLFTVNIIGNIVPNLPGCEALRERGFATIPALILWATALVILWRSAREKAAPAQFHLFPERLAA
jgi:hypothetical protein